MATSTITATSSETGYIKNIHDHTWADAWGTSNAGGYESQQTYEAFCYTISPHYYLSRGRIRFDTSVCQGSVVSATLKIAFNRIVDNTGDNYLHFVGAVGCGDNMDGYTDFPALKNNTVDICDPIRVSDITIDTYIKREFNNLGKELINTLGYTIIGLRLGDDISNTAPVEDVKESWLTWYGGVYVSNPSGYEAKLIVADTGGVASTKDWVTGIVHRVGPGHYSNELILGGLDTRWHYIDYTPEPIPAIPGEVQKEAGPMAGWTGPHYETHITEEGMKWRIYLQAPDGTRHYISMPYGILP